MTDTLIQVDLTQAATENEDASDVGDVDLSTEHYLSGPGGKGAEPGDLLVVDLHDIGAKADSLWGFNGFFSKQNGGGFLTDYFPSAQKSIWDFEGMFTKSRHNPRPGQGARPAGSPAQGGEGRHRQGLSLPRARCTLRRPRPGQASAPATGTGGGRVGRGGRKCAGGRLSLSDELLKRK